MPAKWVLFDVSWLAHRALYTVGRLATDALATGVLFGVFDQIRTTCLDRRVASNRALLFFDSRHSYRRDAYPLYKANRAAKPAEDIERLRVMREQVSLLRREILPAVGFPVYRQFGCESDDLLAMAVKVLPPGDEAVVVTSDNDLLQCVTSQVHWFDPARDLYLDPLEVWRQRGVSPDMWGDVKCLAGCRGDNVPGIPGVGEKTAADYLMHLLNPKHKRHAAIMEHRKEVVARNRELVVLPHARTRQVVLHEPKYNVGAFRTWAERLEFASFVCGPRWAAWEAFFEGRMGRQMVARRRGEVRL